MLTSQKKHLTRSDRGGPNPWSLPGRSLPQLELKGPRGGP